MKLEELIKSVREEKLDKEQLENYRNEISNLFAQMQLEMASLEKSEAIFMNDVQPDEHMTVAKAKVLWKATEKGQRLIVLKRYALACKELLNSLKSRLYSIY